MKDAKIFRYYNARYLLEREWPVHGLNPWLHHTISIARPWIRGMYLCKYVRYSIIYGFFKIELALLVGREVVTRLSRGCHEVVTRLSRGWRKVGARLSHPTHIKTELFALN